jgi:para-nitrobenzyl esterase
VRPNDIQTDLLGAIVSDDLFRIPTIRFAEAAVTANTAPIWMYLFTRPDPRIAGRPKSPHSWDLPFLFDNLDRAPAADLPGGRMLAQPVQRDADCLRPPRRPKPPRTPAWPTYDLERRSTMLLGDECVVADDPFGGERSVWESAEAVGLIAEDGTTQPVRQGAGV